MVFLAGMPGCSDDVDAIGRVLMKNCLAREERTPI